MTKIGIRCKKYLGPQQSPKLLTGAKTENSIILTKDKINKNFKFLLISNILLNAKMIKGVEVNRPARTVFFSIKLKNRKVKISNNIAKIMLSDV
jgi:hypothetical protein